jgi:hypothetical protein
MKKDFTRPKWWLLYLSNIFVFGLFWLEVNAPLSETGHKWVEVGLVIILYGLIMAWIKANEVGLINEEREKYKKKVAWNDLDTYPTNYGHANVISGSGHLLNQKYRLEKRLVSTWLTSLLVLVIAFFKHQEQ